MFLQKIGTLPLRCKKYALGCWVFGGKDYWGPQEEKNSTAAIHAALEAGVNHFDTAQGYGNGKSEEVLGHALKGYDRTRLLIATKFSLKASTNGLAERIEASLERLQTDYVDLFYIHWPSKKIDFRPTLEVLQKYKEKGRIRGIGVSNFSVSQLDSALTTAEIEANQIGYSLLWRWEEKELIPFCRKKKVSVVAYSTLAQGILTGKFGEKITFPETDFRKDMVLFKKKIWPQIYASVEELKTLAAESGLSLASLALYWAANQPGIDSVLFGARTKNQVRENMTGDSITVLPAILKKMTELSDRLHTVIPYADNIFDYHP